MSAFILHTVGFVIGLTTLAIGMCSYITGKLSEIMQKEGKGRGKEEHYYAVIDFASHCRQKSKIFVGIAILSSWINDMHGDILVLLIHAVHQQKLEESRNGVRMKIQL